MINNYHIPAKRPGAALNCLLCLLLLSALLAPLPAAAQEADLIHYTVKDGLPSSIIYNCTQDDKGFMWFATESGVSRFDGARFRNFSLRDGLPDTDVINIASSGDGKIWAVPFSKNPAYFDNQTQTFKNAATDPLLKKIAYSGAILMMSSRRKGMYFYYKELRDVYHYHNGQVDNLTPAPPRKGCEGIYEPDDSITLFFLQNRIVIQRHAGGKTEQRTHELGALVTAWQDTLLFQMPGRAGQTILTKARFDENMVLQVISQHPVAGGFRHVVKHQGRLYVSLNSGGVDVYSAALQFEKKLLEKNLVNSTFFDRDGNIWFNTYSNGIYYKPSSDVKVLLPPGSSQLRFITALLPFGEGKVLAGNMAGALQVFDEYTPGAVNINRQDNYNLLKRARKIIANSNGGFTVITEEAVTYSTAPTPLQFSHFTNKNPAVAMGCKAICEYKPGKYLLATHSTLVRFATPEQKKDTIYLGRCTAAGAGGGGDAWFGTVNGLYYIHDAEKNNYEYVNLNAAGISSTRISAIAEDAQRVVWVATANAGIIALRNRQVALHITEADGLASDVCRTVFIDHATGNIWVATNNGISCISPGWQNGKFSPAIQNYNTTTAGLPDNDINDIFLSNNRVYAATSNGIAIFRPSAARINIPVHIVQVLVKNREMPRQNEYELAHHQNDISIQFTGVCFNCAGKLGYQYRMLSGLNDTAWLPAGSNTVTFSSLKPGRYTFEVKTEAGALVTRVFFYLRPPWYSRWWFWCLCIGVTGALVGLVYRQRIQNIKRTAALAQKMSQLELQALQAQMNPHFIFNSLNAIQHFIAHNDSAAARMYLGRFSKLMRLYLESSRSKYISIDQEQELLSLYLGLEQLRFNNRFEYEVTVDGSIEPGSEIPSMLVQPFAENAVNHGMLHRQEAGGHISIRFSENNGTVYCVVADNGVGREKADAMNAGNRHRHVSRGMQITEDRIKTLQLADGILTEISTEDLYDAAGLAAGTRVTLRITEQKDRLNN